jgi:hypothetical protein
VAVSRRSGDEIHPWLPNGGLRPIPAHPVLKVERPLRSVKRSLTSKKLEAAAFEVVGGDHLRLGVYRNLPKRWSAFATDDALVGGKAFQV